MTGSKFLIILGGFAVLFIYLQNVSIQTEKIKNPRTRAVVRAVFLLVPLTITVVALVWVGEDLMRFVRFMKYR